MTTEVNVRLVIQACIASHGTPLGEKLVDFIQSAAGAGAKRKVSIASRRLIQLHASAGGDEILPFELESFELSLACLLANRVFITKTARRFRQDSAGLYAKIFSSWSLVDKGYALLTKNKCVYVPNATHNSPQEGEAEFEMRPACRPQFSKAVGQFSDAQPNVRVSSDGNLKFIFEFGCAPAIQGVDCRCCIIGPTIGPEFIPATRLLAVGGHSLTLEFLRPEAILQLSAAASKRYSFHVQSDDLDMIFPVPDITSDAPTSKLWSRSFVAWHGYLKGSIDGDIDLPKDIAKECVRRYWWMTLSDKEIMLDAISATKIE